MKKYDVIIAGASFAGLAVASRIKNKKVLLIDKEDIGSHVRSACGTTVKLMKKINCGKSILQTFNRVTLHIKKQKIDIPLIEKYCTIDYEKFCKLFNKQNDAKFIKATVKSTDGKIVYTDKGNFEADIIVDCTGWSAVLASSLNKNYVKKNMLSFGIETEILYKRDNKLRFFVDPSIIKDGAAWLFPAGKKTRFGVGSYKGETKLIPNLRELLKRYNLKEGKIHGGYFCYCLKKPIVKNIFVVGCAAGQTLPLTGEGIRRSIIFGQLCGDIIKEVLNNKKSLIDALKKYKDIVLKHDKEYKILLKSQKLLPLMANWEIGLIARLLSIKPVTEYIWEKYEKT